MRLRSTCAVALLVAAMAGCTVTATAPRVVVHTPPVAEIVVTRPPPPVRVEEVAPPPPHHPELYVWHRGHWQWERGEYVWIGGHYERRPTAAAVWVQPEWVARGGQWVYQPGHWVYR
jgi:hypothetical protein